MPRGVAARVAGLTVVAAVLVAGCGSGSGSRGSGAPSTSRAVTSPAAAAACRGSGTESAVTGADAAAMPGVTRLRIRLVDPSRPTAASGDERALPCRVLVTEVRLPAGAPGARPLIVVAHGLDGDPSALALLLDHWAQAGFVVAAPRFPTTEKDAGGDSVATSPEDQAADLSFVIDQLLLRDGGPATDPLTGRIDPAHIGAAGMSLGGQAIYGLVANTCCRDPRVDAAIMMAAVYRELPHGRYHYRTVPVLLVHGDADRGYHNSVQVYPRLRAPKWFITLHGAGHSEPFESPPGPQAPLVRATTVAFWDRYLDGDVTGAGRIVSLIRATDGHASLRHVP